MIQGSGNTSLRKQDLENQRIPAVGFQKVVFGHKATAGQTSINLTSLTLPPEMSTNGFTNPSTATLQAANLLFYRKNLTLKSSLRGTLTDQLSYNVATSTSISFIGFTASEGEIFTGQIDYVATGSARVVGTSITPASGTIAIGTTDFNTGTPFKVAQNSSSQVGAVLFFVDGVLQTRNTGNSSTTLDGNYYEVDAGGGLGVILRLNQAATQILNVLVISNGILYERPDGSMLATIENVNGYLQNMATYLAAATGQTVATVLGASATGVDLKAFGDRVFALEQNRARTDLANTWTAAQNMLGRTDGGTIPSGAPGEVVTWASAPTDQNFSTIGTTADWTNATITVPAGSWVLYANLPVSTQTGAGTSNTAALTATITDSSNNIVKNLKKSASIQTAAAVNVTSVQCLSFSTTLEISTPTVYKIRGVINGNTGSVGNLFNTNANGQAEFFAVRKA